MTITQTFSRILRLALLFCPVLCGAEQCYITNTQVPVLISGCTYSGVLPGGATSYIQNTSSLQAGSTFYVNTGTLAYGLTVGTFTDTSSTAHYVPVAEGNSSPFIYESPSTSGYVLTSNGTSADPTFQAAASGGGTGRYLQIISSQTTGAFATTSNSFVDASLHVTITDAKNTDINEIKFNGIVSMYGNWAPAVTIFRDSTNLGNSSLGLATFYTANISIAPLALDIFDTPGDTSAHTYKMYIRSTSGNVALGDSVEGFTPLPMTLTAMEISQ